MQLFGIWQGFAGAVRVEQKARQAMANLGGTRVYREGAAQNIHSFAGAAGLHTLIRARQQRADVACGKPRFRFRPVAPFSHVPAMFVSPKIGLWRLAKAWPCYVFTRKEGSSSFLKKRTKKLLFP
jgi:hypothetical protein